MRPYEVLFIAPPDLSPEESDGLVNWVADAIRERGGEVEEIERWGRRRLAYEIAGRREGEYTLIRYRAPEGLGRELEGLLRYRESVLRFTIVRREE